MVSRPSADLSKAASVVPLDHVRFKRPMHLGRFARDAWRSRAMVVALSERELRARYKQALLGVAWAFIGPLGYVLVFTVFFNRVADVETNGVPYVLFSYLGLIPWGFFSAALMTGSIAPLANVVLLNKVACPREVFTLSAIATAAVDAAITALALPVLFITTGFWPKATSLWLPLIVSAQLAFGLGLALLLGAILMFIRDVRHLLPILAQMLLFATPVAYGFSEVPESWRLPYSLVNPMAPIIEAYRTTILYGHAPDWQYFGPGAGVAIAVLVAGYLTFKRLEPGFADVA
jgi:ABC-2 type transport system permease protein/lipopolysaccharide transport system permease protein